MIAFEVDRETKWDNDVIGTNLELKCKGKKRGDRGGKMENWIGIGLVDTCESLIRRFGKRELVIKIWNAKQVLIKKENMGQASKCLSLGFQCGG